MLCAFVVSATGLHPADHYIDLLEPLGLRNTTRAGVTYILGHQELKPAYYLQGKSNIYYS